jgi:hypothetical protein
MEPEQTEPEQTEESNGEILDNFLEEIKKHRFMLVCASKGGGKSYFVCAFLKYAFENKLYEKYYLAIPAYKNEADDQYEFIKSQPKKMITVFDKYSPEVSEYVFNRVAEGEKESLFVIEDSTGFLDSHSSTRDPKLKLITTTTRHIKCTLIIVSHATKSILQPVIRANTDFLLLFKITNENVINDIWEEYRMLLPYNNIKEFVRDFDEKVNKNKHNGMFINFITNDFTMDYLNEFANLLSYNENIEKEHDYSKQREKGRIQQEIPREEDEGRSTSSSTSYGERRSSSSSTSPFPSIAKFLQSRRNKFTTTH